jgi:signal recognition particle receptor subunit beta
MALVNHAKREINAKIVYYGPEMAGKATSLRYVYDRIKPALRGELKALPASGSSLLFFDFSPFEQPVFGGYRIRLHIYTLQGKVANPAAWKMTLKGADGLVVVADTSLAGLSGSGESVVKLREFLGSYGVGLHDIPFVLQLNKKDLNGELSLEEAVQSLGLPDCPLLQTSALKGDGVLEVLTSLSRLVIERIGRRDDLLQSAVSTGAENIVAVPESIGIFPSEARKTPVSTQAAMAGISSCSEDLTGNNMPVLAEHVVRLSDGGVTIDGTTVRIPLEIANPDGVQRLVVTVSVSTV